MKYLTLLIILLFLAGCGGNYGIIPAQKETTWTVLIYMNGNSGLETMNGLKIKELENLPYSSKVNIIAQESKLSLHGKTKRFLFNGKKEELEDLGVIDMSEPENLKKFIIYGMEKYPADYYILNIYTHGGGWKGLLRDDVSKNAMNLQGLKMALNIEGKPDIVSFEACNMGTIETSYELKDSADIMIGSEDDTPVSGWPYEIIWNSLIENPDQTPHEFSKNIVRTYIEYNNQNNMTNITLSAIDMAHMDRLAENIKNFVDSQKDYENIMENIKIDREKSLLFNNKSYIDIKTFFQLTGSNNIYPEDLRNKSLKITEELNNTVILWEKTPGSSNAKGLSIYFPPSGENMIDYNNNNYSDIDFGEYSKWESFVLKLYK